MKVRDPRDPLGVIPPWAFTAYLVFWFCFACFVFDVSFVGLGLAN